MCVEAIEREGYNMLLTDGEILAEIEQGGLKIEDFDPDGLQPARRERRLPSASSTRDADEPHPRDIPRGAVAAHGAVPSTCGVRDSALHSHGLQLCLDAQPLGTDVRSQGRVNVRSHSLSPGRANETSD